MSLISKLKIQELNHREQKQKRREKKKERAARIGLTTHRQWLLRDKRMKEEKGGERGCRSVVPDSAFTNIGKGCKPTPGTGPGTLA